MPVLSEDCKPEENKRSNRNFIRIQNLPWTACRSDVKQFFHGLPIKKGGILVRNFEAFVAFENPSDVRLALHRRNIFLHGFKVELSVINTNELHTILLSIVRRKLDFGSINRDSTKLHSHAPLRRKIRPTPVSNGDKRRSVSCSTFLPEETVILQNGSTSFGSSFAGMTHCGKRLISGMRKLHPTSLPETMEMEKIAIFHPEECYEAKKIKLDVWQFRAK